MPRGLPDYYNPDTLVSQRLANIEELLTQLRGVASSDNRGRTWVYDNFSEGFDYLNFTESGDGLAPALSIEEVEVSPCSIKMSCGTVSGGGGMSGQKFIIVNTPPKVGFEIGYTYWKTGAQPLMILEYETDANTYIARMRVNPDTGAVDIYTGSDWVNVGAVAHTSVYKEWLTIKLVADFVNLTYLRAIIGQKQINLEDYDLQVAGGDCEGQLMIGIDVDPVDDGLNLIYLGHLAITIDEP